MPVKAVGVEPFEGIPYAAVECGGYRPCPTDQVLNLHPDGWPIVLLDVERHIHVDPLLLQDVQGKAVNPRELVGERAGKVERIDRVRLARDAKVDGAEEIGAYIGVIYWRRLGAGGELGQPCGDGGLGDARLAGDDKVARASGSASQRSISAKTHSWPVKSFVRSAI